MTEETAAARIIAALNRQDPLAECGDCGHAFRLHRSGLFYVTDLSEDAGKQLQHWKAELDSEHADLRKRRRRISEGSQVGAKAVNLGFVLETLAPSLPSFPFNPRDCRALGDPVDLMIFDGLTQHGRVDRIVIGDVKTGNARLSDRQKSIRTAIERKRIEWSLYDAD